MYKRLQTNVISSIFYLSGKLMETSVFPIFRKLPVSSIFPTVFEANLFEL